jgi:hypothetical protein
MNEAGRRASGADATADDLARSSMHRALRLVREAIPPGTADPDSIRAAMEECELVNLWRALPQAERRNVLEAAHLATRIAAELQRVQRGAAPSRGEEPAD